MTRKRGVYQAAKNGGHLCDGELSQTKSCNNQPCDAPQDCGLADWGAWSACTASCGGGQRDRQRSIATPEKNGGKPCEGAMTELQACNEEECPDVQDCELLICMSKRKVSKIL